MASSKYFIDLNLQPNKSETFELSNNSKKYILSKLNEEMKLNFSKFIQHYQIKIKDRNYFKEYLSDISEELISISHKKKGISRLNFIKYFNLPGMISLRLFSAFNTNKCDEDFLSADDFIENMLNLYTGNPEYLFKLIFKLFDFNNTGNISHDEVSLILNFIPIKHSSYNNNKFKFEHDEFIDRVKTQEDIELAIKILFSSQNLISFNDFVEIIKYKNSDVFIFLLLYIFERKPFSKEIIQLYKDENISEEEELNSKENNDDKKEDIFIESPIIKESKIKYQQLLNDKENTYNINFHKSKSDKSIFLASKNHKEKDITNIESKDNRNIIYFH